ncbi:hypothetical protein DdX_19122 [Ditylenchus destructor]|uniref:Uncharacterized protein n=1 Tax=Ditylenchus destructor TaxID=166010 RepID=A0AAD4QUD8_9BILA|nr:hypothetical protein DdX_19122 [Ditylenchus destructor]
MNSQLFYLFVISFIAAGILAQPPPPDSPNSQPKEPARPRRESGNPPMEPNRPPRQAQCNPACASGEKCFNGQCVTKKECSPTCSDSQKCNHMTGQCFTPVQCNPSCVVPQHCNPLNGTCMTMPAGMPIGGLSSEEGNQEGHHMPGMEGQGMQGRGEPRCNPACSDPQKCNPMTSKCFTPVECNPTCSGQQHCNPVNGTCMTMPSGMPPMHMGGQQL